MPYSHEVAEDRIAELSSRGLDLPTFWQECASYIARVVPFYTEPCWFTLDPASLLITSHYQPSLPELPPEWLAHEYYEDDFQSISSVASSKKGASTLWDATGGEPVKSRSWREILRPMGGDQELLVSLRQRGGSVWGVLGLYREPDRPLFNAEEVAFLQRCSPHLAAGAQRALLIGEASSPEGPESPGLVVLNSKWEIDSLTPGADRWLEELPGSDWSGGSNLPPALLAVAGRAARTADERGLAGEVAFSRVLSKAGRWIVLHGASMVGGGSTRVAIIIEPAHPARIAPLLMAAYQLTNREQEVTRLVLRGDSTTQIATALSVSPHTVQQHLKTIFEKTGVRSRRDLTGKVFFAHYEPRVRDNEHRVMDGHPMRGGPSH